MTDILQARLQHKGILLADGAVGTNLFAMGLQTGDSPELWNVDHPERIEQLHRGFIDAGSDIILTNSFGGTHYRLGLHNAQARVAELNIAAANIAQREVRRSDRDILIAGSMGPTGEILEPNGAVSIVQAAEAFSEQATALAKGGADLLWIETISSREEIIAAVTGAASADLPIVLTVSIDTNGRTMMGLTPEDLVSIAFSLDHTLAALGTNCGVGAAEVVTAVANLNTAAERQQQQPVIVAKANCGIPEYMDGRIVYNGTPQIMHAYATLAANAGAQIIGGCCGTTPEHIRAMRNAIDHHKPGPKPGIDLIVATLGEVSKGAQAQMRGEMSLAAGSTSGRGARQSRRRKKTNS